MTYIAYYRVSKLSASGKQRKEKGESSLGIEAQKYIVRNYYSPVKEYEEVASAKDVEHRPVLQQVIRECLETGATLVTAKLDRLSRKVEDALAIYDQLGHRLICCDIPNLDKFTLTLFVAFSERERTLIQLRVKAALAAKKAKDGPWYNREKADPKFLNGEYAAEGRKVRIAAARNNPNNIRACQMISTLMASGKTTDQIIRILNANEFKTSQGHRFSQGTQVRRMLGMFGQYTAKQRVRSENVIEVPEVIETVIGKPELDGKWAKTLIEASGN